MYSQRKMAGHAARLFAFLALFLTAAFAHAASLELSPGPSRALDFLNNGHVLEADKMLREYRKMYPEDVQGLFLFAMTRWKMMSLRTYDKKERAELVAIMDRVESLCEPHIKADDDALFFYSAVQGIRAQMLGSEGDWWATAKLGKKMKRTALDLLERNPGYNEAYYLVGSYNYMADALPGAIKFLRTLMFFPGGDKAEGMKQLIRAYEKGNLASIDAGRTLAYIYTYLEKDPSRGVEICDKVLSRCPDVFDIGVYRGINLYYNSAFQKAEESLTHTRQEIRAYSRMHVPEPEIVPVYTSVEREARYWIARSLLQQKRVEDAEKLLLELKTPEIHQPYWIQRGVFLSLAQVAYSRKDIRGAEHLIARVLDWQDVKDAHEKARLLKKQKGAVAQFAVEFR